MVSSSPLIEDFYVIGIILISCVGGYAAYWSFAIRRALRVPLYKRQLVWVGSTSLYAIFLIFTYYVSGPGPAFIPSALASNPSVSAINKAAYVLLPVVLLVWLDSSVQVARRSDPLLRDPFRWNRSRVLLWATIIFGSVLISITALAPPQPVLSDHNIISVFGYTLGFALQYLVLAVAAVALLVGGRRSGDANFRGSQGWYFAALVVTIAGNVASFLLIAGNPLADTPVDLAWGFAQNFIVWPLALYLLYKCARSLVPLNKLVPPESD
jgi:hypothetical protein